MVALAIVLNLPDSVQDFFHVLCSRIDRPISRSAGAQSVLACVREPGHGKCREAHNLLLCQRLFSPHEREE